MHILVTRLILKVSECIRCAERSHSNEAPAAGAHEKIRFELMIHFDAYEDIGGKWRWRLIAANGATVASSGEAFDSHANAIRAAERVKALAPEAEITTTPAGIKDVIAALVKDSLARQS